MNYSETNAGRVQSQASEGGSVGPFWTFDLVEERMVEAVLLWRRAPDRERGWQTSRAFWPDIMRHTWFGDYADTEASPRPLPLTRAEVAEMNDVGEWLRFVPERDRKLVGLALAQLAAGHKQVSWKRVRSRLDAETSPRGLGMRYRRAIAAICQALNSRKSEANQRGEVSTRKIDSGANNVCSSPGGDGRI